MATISVVVPDPTTNQPVMKNYNVRDGQIYTIDEKLKFFLDSDDSQQIFLHMSEMIAFSNKLKSANSEHVNGNSDDVLPVVISPVIDISTVRSFKARIISKAERVSMLAALKNLIDSKTSFRKSLTKWKGFGPETVLGNDYIQKLAEMLENPATRPTVLDIATFGERIDFTMLSAAGFFRIYFETDFVISKENWLYDIQKLFSLKNITIKLTEKGRKNISKNSRVHGHGIINNHEKPFIRRIACSYENMFNKGCVRFGVSSREDSPFEKKTNGYTREQFYQLIRTRMEELNATLTDGEKCDESNYGAFWIMSYDHSSWPKAHAGVKFSSKNDPNFLRLFDVNKVRVAVY